MGESGKGKKLRSILSKQQNRRGKKGLFLSSFITAVTIELVVVLVVKTCFESDLEFQSFRDKSYKQMWLQLRCCTLTCQDLVSVNFNVQRYLEVHRKIEIEEMISGMTLEVRSKSQGCGVKSEVQDQGLELWSKVQEFGSKDRRIRSNRLKY